jgi:thiosulfate/3-mercaptopyruvate sulfurtransferase
VTLGGISITGERGLRLEMPPVAALEEAFRRLGVTDASHVVVYPADESVQSATRVWFTLDYLGMSDRASLLDGGLAAWKAEGRPLSTEAPRPAAGTFTARPAAERIVNAEWIRAHLSDSQVQVIDARLPEFYSGANAGGMPRAGRVPGARSVPFSSVLDEQRKLKPPESLRELLTARPAALTVAYCHIGHQATLVYFAARYLGLEARLYDGSFQDWSTRTEMPVEMGR